MYRADMAFVQRCRSYFVAVGMMVFTVVSVNTFDRNDRDLFGLRFYISLSDSMSATDFDAGDLVIVKEVDPTTLKEGGDQRAQKRLPIKEKALEGCAF